MTSTVAGVDPRCAAGAPVTEDQGFPSVTFLDGGGGREAGGEAPAFGEGTCLASALGVLPGLICGEADNLARQTRVSHAENRRF